jgi:hypothetical protein
MKAAPITQPHYSLNYNPDANAALLFTRSYKCTVQGYDFVKATLFLNLILCF